MSKKIILLSLLFATFLFSCGDDDDIETCDSFTATYDGDVKAIINSTCAYAGCHSGGSTAGQTIPTESNDFTTFASLQPILDADRFNARALVAQNMPPADFVPEGFPTELTEEELEILTCWHEAGYPEN